MTLERRLANLSVDIVSSICVLSGQILAIIIILEVPPIESLSKYVNFDCLKGRLSLFFSEYPTTSYSKKLSDLLIKDASKSEFP